MHHPRFPEKTFLTREECKKLIWDAIKANKIREMHGEKILVISMLNEEEILKIKEKIKILDQQINIPLFPFGENSSNSATVMEAIAHKTAQIAIEQLELSYIQAYFATNYINEITFYQVPTFIFEADADKRFNSPAPHVVEICINLTSLTKLSTALQTVLLNKDLMNLEIRLDSLEQQIASQKREIKVDCYPDASDTKLNETFLTARREYFETNQKPYQQSYQDFSSNITFTPNVYQPPSIEFISYIHPKAHKELSNIPLDDVNKRKEFLTMEIKRAQEETVIFDNFIAKNSNSMQQKR